MAAPRIPTATTYFGNLTDADLATQAAAIIAGLSSVAGAAMFPDIPVPTATLTTTRTSYLTALAAAVDGSKAETADKNVQKGLLQTYLAQNAQYVNSVVRGQVNVIGYDVMTQSILLSGYRISYVPLPKVTLPAPEEFTAKVKVINGTAQPGIVDLRYKRSAIRDNRGYGTRWMWKTVAGTTWNEKSTSGASTLIDGLTSGEAYMFKCVQIGNKTTIVSESDTITVNVL